MSVLALALLSFTPSVPNFSPLTYQADSGLSYSYLQLGIGSGEMDIAGVSLDFDEVVVSGSFELNDSIFGILAFNRGDIDTGVPGVSLETEGVQVGIGFHTAVSSGTDIYGALSYIDTKLTASISGLGSSRVAEDGHAIGIGIRSRISEQIELGVGWNIVEIGDADSEQSLNFGAVFDVSDRVGLGLTIVNSDNFDAVLVGLRVYL
jgi:hypothetical protein